ncbi:COG3904 family protein [Lysobacter claricitrinus]|uniref:COG3904 family protein n=1 Tax=Lysobacter claricitrinus TaxID=3367728 RepID=UPI0038B40DDF
MRRSLVLALALLLTACGAAPPPAAHAPVTLGDNAVAPMPANDEPQPQPADDLSGTHWPAARVERGLAQVSCERDDADDPPRALDSLEFFPLYDAMATCASTGLVRLHYSGRIDGGFTELTRRVSAMAQRMDLPERLLDIDSAGGHVEEAIRAGDALADAKWTVRVQDDANCLSACVLVLAAADDRVVHGKVGVHRLMRDRSNATSRAELNDELRNVNALVREYFERHGVALAVADLMMTVPNRRLRLLTPDELDEYGLVGRNAAQDDLERIVIRRKCGEDFMRRRDAFERQFEARCGVDEKPWDDVTRCGLELRSAYGFPDAKCADETPLADAQRRLDLETLRQQAAQLAAAEATPADGTDDAPATGTNVASNDSASTTHGGATRNAR